MCRLKFLNNDAIFLENSYSYFNILIRNITEKINQNDNSMTRDNINEKFLTKQTKISKN